MPLKRRRRLGLASIGVPADEQDRRRARCCCPACARPLQLERFEAGAVAVWQCRCGYETEALPRSHLYQVARAQLGEEGRSCR